MEASLRLLAVCFATVKELFLLYLSSLKGCGPALNNLNWQGTVEEEREESTAKTAFLRKTKKKKNHPSSAHSKPIPEIYNVLGKAALRTANVKSFSLTLRKVFSCQITTQENTIIRIKKETKKLTPQGREQELPAPFREKSTVNPIHFPTPSWIQPYLGQANLTAGAQI